MRSCRTQNSFFESSTQQISSLSTEQYQNGVKNSIKNRTKQRLQKSSRRQSKRWTMWDHKVHIPRDDQQASGNRFQNARQGFEDLDTETLFASVCGAAAFWELVSVGMRCKTIPDVDDGVGGRTPACREYTHLREQTNSRIYAAIAGNTIIGPVLHGRMVKISWQLWIRNSNSFHGNARSNFVGNCMPRKEPIRGEFISPRSRTNPRELRFVGKIYRKFQRTLLRWSHLLQTSGDREISWRRQGSPCESGCGTTEISGQRRVYSYWWQEVERYSRL